MALWPFARRSTLGHTLGIDLTKPPDEVDAQALLDAGAAVPHRSPCFCWLVCRQKRG